MYMYYDLLDDVNCLAHYGIETGTIGASESGKLIPYVHLGEKKGNQIIITGGIHAREHVSSLMCVKQIFAIANSEPVFSGGIYFVPMVNPDGNLLVAGLAEFENYDYLVKLNGGSSDFSLWKANARGVDLNTNFDAHWGEGQYNVYFPGAENFVGDAPFSESETYSLAQFTKKIQPSTTISYHALGQEVYWEFFQTDNKTRDKKFAEFVNKQLKYNLIDGDGMSTGGYKDWCIEKLKISALTIELVSNKFSHPLSDDSLNGDIARNRYLPLSILNYINKTQKQ